MGTVRRLLQFASLLFLLTMLLAPLAECFDAWDPPGLADDTEFAVFGFALILCLVLLVCRFIASLALEFDLAESSKVFRGVCSFHASDRALPPLFIPPLRSPLRI